MNKQLASTEHTATATSQRVKDIFSLCQTNWSNLLFLTPTHQAQHRQQTPSSRHLNDLHLHLHLLDLLPSEVQWNVLATGLIPLPTPAIQRHHTAQLWQLTTVMTTDEHNVQLEINHRHIKSTAKPLKNPAEMWLSGLNWFLCTVPQSPYDLNETHLITASQLLVMAAPTNSKINWHHVKTRSQAVARIADRTAKNCKVTWPRPRLLSGKLFMRLLGIAHTKPCIKFEVSSSSSFKDMFDRMPKIVGVTWPRPQPLSGKISCAPALHSQYKAAYQIWSL